MTTLVLAGFAIFFFFSFSCRSRTFFGGKYLISGAQSDSFFLFDSIIDVVQLANTERQSGNDTEQQRFIRVLSNCQMDSLDEQDWSVFKERFGGGCQKRMLG